MDPKIAYIKDNHIYVKQISRDTLNDISEEEENTSDSVQ